MVLTRRQSKLLKQNSVYQQIKSDQQKSEVSTKNLNIFDEEESNNSRSRSLHRFRGDLYDLNCKYLTRNRLKPVYKLNYLDNLNIFIKKNQENLDQFSNLDEEEKNNHEFSVYSTRRSSKTTNYKKFNKNKISSKSVSENIPSIAHNSTVSNKNQEEKCSIESEDDGVDRTQDAGHYQFQIGEIINDTYIIQEHISDGTFGRVFNVKNTKNNQIYAMKMIRAVERYIESAKIEAEILSDIQSNDHENQYNIVRFYESFEYQKNYCMIFEKLGLSLYDFLKFNKYQGYPIKLIQTYFKQILISIDFIHQLGITHTDLKPENILLQNSDYYTITAKKENEFFNNDIQKVQQQNIPKSNTVKIIDFGGATKDDEHHSSLINTRQYRSPEVILGCCEWDHSSDVWCIAAIIIELYSGDLYFDTHENYQHLAMIQKSSGNIPYWMAKKSQLNDLFKFNSNKNNNQNYLKWPQNVEKSSLIRQVENMKTLDDIFEKKDHLLQDLIQQMLEIDPKKRISCKKALEHPFFQIQYN